MSRSNPNENSTPNPAARWFEWNGELGIVRYYDKIAKKNVDVGDDFTFILLDQLGSVRGWHDASDSGIYSNEVKDTRQEAMVVKSFKGGTLVEGIYKDIKDRVNAVGGQFVANCYIACKNGGNTLEIASLRFKGAALGAWMEFGKNHRADLYKKAVRIKGYTEGKKGRITFRMPVLSLVDLSPETDKQAIALDATLQEFLKSYFKRTKVDQVEVHNEPERRGDEYAQPPPPSEPITELTDDDIPF
jgi:hypothetical protein